MMNKPLINVKDAAAQMGIAFQTLQMALKAKMYPFGEAIPCKGRYRYVIIRSRFEKYMSGGDMTQSF